MLWGCLVTILSFDAYKNEAQRHSLAFKEAEAIAAYKKLSLYTGMQVVPLYIIKSGVVNAWTDGSAVVMTTALLEQLQDKDQIAAVLAHEMAHVLLGHVGSDGRISITNLESHADKMGVYLMLKAGYDPCKGREVWTMFKNMGSGDYADTYAANHPSYAFRYESMTMPWCAK